MTIGSRSMFLVRCLYFHTLNFVTFCLSFDVIYYESSAMILKCSNGPLLFHVPDLKFKFQNWNVQRKLCFTKQFFLSMEAQMVCCYFLICQFSLNCCYVRWYCFGQHHQASHYHYETSSDCFLNQIWRFQRFLEKQAQMKLFIK